ncbi:hypothetical protein ABW20_dc0108310 [Dactylellina cionopaga]|nr:hypothetical protein ABW20_dc0108310 [Dactylellina cionopaga]
MLPHPLNKAVDEALTAREKILRFFSVTVRSKPNWTEDILDRSLFVKWVKEVEAYIHDGYIDDTPAWTAEDIAYSYDELINVYKPYVEKMRERGSLIEPDIDAVWRSDRLIDEDLRRRLIDAVETLGDGDWIDKRRVLSLVDPSLWPIVYGRTHGVDGKPVYPPKEAIYFKGQTESVYEGYSDKFCLLPSEFEVSDDGKVQIASYINNLSKPEQKALFYPILESIFEKLLPMFDKVIANLTDGVHRLTRVDKSREYDGAHNKQYLAQRENLDLWEEMLAQFERGEKLTVNFDAHLRDHDDKHERSSGCNPDCEDGFSEDEIAMSELGNLSGQKWSPPESTGQLEGKSLKVIVKMENIILTPEMPHYNGWGWDIEATKNERIVAVGIYTYAQENITDCNLGFQRTFWEGSINGNSRWIQVHGLPENGRTVEQLGSVETKENHAVVFPNVYQHLVHSFSLVDRTKPGYRNVLIFLLCDPAVDNLPTTKDIAPQQPETRYELEKALREGPLGKFPEEILCLILAELPPVVTHPEALRYRQDLVKDRRRIISSSGEIDGTYYNM